MSDSLSSSPAADTSLPGTCGDICFVLSVTVEPIGEFPDVPARKTHPYIPDSPPTPPQRNESSLPLEDSRSTQLIPEPVYPPHERLLSEGCAAQQKAPKSDAPIYSFRQDRVGSEFDHRRFRDQREAATRAGRAVISVDEYCKYPVFEARRFRAVSPVLGLEVSGRDGWVNDKDRAETWNQRWVHSGCRISVPIHMDLKFLRRASERQYCERLGRMFQHYRVRNFSEKTPSEPDITLLCYGDFRSQGLYWFGQRTRLGSDAAQESRIHVRSLLRESRSFMWTWNCEETFDVDRPGYERNCTKWNHLLPTFREIMVNRAAAPSSESQPIPVSRPPVSIPPTTRADTPVWEYDPNRAYLCESPEMRQLPPSTGIRSLPRLFQPEAASHDRDTGVREP